MKTDAKPAGSGVLSHESREWLKNASRWRLLSLLFQLPTRESRRELNQLARGAPKKLGAVAKEWTRIPMKTAAAEFHRIFGPGGIPAAESSYDPNALAGRGPLLADIAGFHEAFAYRPEKPPADVPDHIAMELDFLSYLAFKTAFALHGGNEEEGRISAQAYKRFIEEHLGTWMPAFRERIEHTAPPSFVQALVSISDAVSAGRRHRRQSSLATVVILLLGVLLGPARMEGQTSHRPDASTQIQGKEATGKPAASTPSPKPLKIGKVIVSGSLRGRMENWGWFETPGGTSDYTFGAFNLRLALEQKTERLEWKVEGLFPWLIGLPTNAVRPPPQGQLGLGASYFAASGRQDGSAILRHGYVRFKKLFGGPASSIRLGRFEFADGAEMMPADATLATLKRDRIAHRLIGNFGFSHVGRGFDGVEYAWNGKTNNFTFVAARPTEGVFQLRSLKQLDVDFYYGAFTQQFGGNGAKGEARVFVLHYHDGRGALKTDNRPQAARVADRRNIRLTTIGGHYLGVFGRGPGKTDLLAWGTGQFGHWGELDHRAAAIAVEAGRQFAGRWNPWLRAGYFRSTGDGNASDGDHTTFFQVLPTPRIYARFPFHNLMNNEDWFAELRLRPKRQLVLRADIRYLRLSSRGDLWYLGGGAFQRQTFGYVGRPSNQSRVLGTLFDLSLDYDFTSTTRLSFYAAGVRGGGVQSAIYPDGGRHPTAHFVYIEFVQRF